MSDDRPEKSEAESSEEQSSGPPKSPTDESTVTALPDTGDPQQIGPYRILQKIGEGGMGIVYEAEQETPVRRRVALKLIKWGMDTKQVVARFEAERQALALMNHPNVAKVFDAGATNEGRPYFVMELVKGVPITGHCDRQRLTTRERLELFMQVCEGVQHAHQKGIIHRDIKPSNILVEIHEGRVVPKIIDFGVAKATEHRLTERTLFTELGQLVGTPEYMSPEQAEMTHQDIDTRTDVYSLGVILYELLVGALPLDPKELRKAGFDEIRRRIREEEPKKPSDRANSLSAESNEQARRRGTDSRSMTKTLRGELDWIVLKALEKDRVRRYNSASEFEADIGHFLQGNPVSAAPHSTWYQLRKLLAKNKQRTLAWSAIILAFAAALPLAALLAFVWDLNLMRSIERRREANFTQRAASFQERLFRRMIMGEDFKGRYDEGERIDLETVETLQRVLGADDPTTLLAMQSLARTYSNQRRYDEAERLHLEVLETRKRVHGNDNPETLYSMKDLADLYRNQGRYDEAEPLYLEALEGFKRMLGDDDAAMLTHVKKLVLLSYQGRYDEAEPLILENLETMNDLGTLYWNQGRYDEAESLYLETLEARKHVLGDDHPDTLWSMNNLAWLLLTREPEESRDPHAALQLALEVAKRAKYKNPNWLDTLSLAYHLIGNTAEAIETQKKALALLPEGADRTEYEQRLAEFEAALRGTTD